MNNPRKIGHLIFLYIRRDLNFLQAKKLRDWRDLSEANELFFQRETSTEHIRERLRTLEQKTLIIREKVRAGYPADWVEGAPVKQAIVIRMLKTAAVVIGALLILAGGSLVYEMFIDTASPKNFAMMITVNGQRVIMNDAQLGFAAGIRGIQVKRKGHEELLYTIPNELKAAKGQSDTLWSSDKWRFELQLPDKTDIWMNLSSRISYPMNFDSSDSVSYSMEGEAFFRIPENTKKYYEIRTDFVAIEATGAELDVRSDIDGKGSAVLLISGTASVRTLQRNNSSDKISLKPGQQARLVGGKWVVEEHPDIKIITAWKR